MLRLIAITLVGLYVAFITLGQDLSPNERAALETRKDEQSRRVKALSAKVADPFAPESKRQGDYVPTLTELRDREAFETQDGLVQLASLSTPPTAILEPTIAVQTNTTRVTDTEKLMELLHPNRTATKNVATKADLREVTGARVNVRSGPSTSNAVLDQVTLAEIVRVISDEDNGWVKIVIEGDGVEGYMSAKFLKSYE